jgi:uncharacterized protein YkwD
MLRTMLVCVFSVCLSVGAMCYAETKTANCDQSGVCAYAQPELSESERAFFDLINAHRKSIGLAPLEPCPNLMFGARRWATKNGWGHASHGFNGECIAPAGDAQSAFNVWLKSPRHKRIMEGASYRYGGIGFTRGRAVLRMSIEPWTYQDTSSRPQYVMRSSFRSGLFSSKARVNIQRRR